MRQPDEERGLFRRWRLALSGRVAEHMSRQFDRLVQRPRALLERAGDGRGEDEQAREGHCDSSGVHGGRASDVSPQPPDERTRRRRLGAAVHHDDPLDEHLEGQSGSSVDGDVDDQPRDVETVVPDVRELEDHPHREG